ncbi:hypothetical protein [Wolbachia endosymbiont of Ctenocephalides felis wCfeJ]|uniref:hypothetical protein n=1 Tax=Wolbachia endosymbiont of Ctenocephalides felis wCfeJ TaxID=2732594 RepID=UPI001444A4D2|nr:hypothetical protein [Wolbachia endosymbiont of Ctenocephalides felis wCfeJ]
MLDTGIQRKKWIPVSSTGMTRRGHWGDIVETIGMTSTTLSLQRVTLEPTTLSFQRVTLESSRKQTRSQCQALG